MKDAEFYGRHVLVTGGASGIGAAAAERFAGLGARLTIADLNLDAAEVLATSLAGAIALPVDVSDPDDVAALFETACAQIGPVDVVVHCAGIDDPATKALIATSRASGAAPDITTMLTDEQWSIMLRVNLSGTFYVLRASLGQMLRRGRGAVVIIGSQAGISGAPAYPHYSAAKGGVHALCRSVAAEVSGRGVRINCIAPGRIDTPMLSRVQGGAALGDNVARLPIGRLGRADEVAAVAVFLASDDASYIVGETVLVNGGLLTI